jgi:hypothetical protein
MHYTFAIPCSRPPIDNLLVTAVGLSLPAIYLLSRVPFMAVGVFPGSTASQFLLLIRGPFRYATGRVSQANVREYSIALPMKANQTIRKFSAFRTSLSNDEP